VRWGHIPSLFALFGILETVPGESRTRETHLRLVVVGNCTVRRSSRLAGRGHVRW
jgi:hypothetical protein